MRTQILLILLFISSLSFAQNDFYLAENYFREGEYEKATQIYKKLVDKNKYNTIYLKRLITCYQETEKFDLVEQILTKRLEQNPTLFYLNIEIGYNYERQQKTVLAIPYYEKALAGIESNPSLGGTTGRLFKENNLLDYAIKAYRKTMSVTKGANFEFQIAQIYGEKGDFNKMFSSYVDLVDRNENYLGTVKRFVSRYISDDASDESNVMFKRALLKKSISNPKNIWNELLSWLFTRQQEYLKAFVQEKALFKRDPNYLGNINALGRTAFNNKDYEAAKDCFSFVLSNTNFLEEKLYAHLYYLKSLVETNDKSVESLFKKVLKKYGITPSTLKIQTAYADYLTFKKNDPTTAKEILETALSLNGSKFEKARIKLKLGDVLIFMGKYNKALIYFSQIQTRLKNHQLAQEARFKVAQTSFFKGDFKWAMAQLKVLKGSTTQLIANDAVDLFLVISDNEPKDSIPTGLSEFARADLLAFQNKDQEAIEVFSKILETYKGQPIEDETLYKQAMVYAKQGQFENAVTNYLKIISLDPQGILVDDAYYQLGELYYSKLNDAKKASEYYEKIIFDFGSSIYLVDARKKFRILRGDTVN